MDIFIYRHWEYSIEISSELGISESKCNLSNVSNLWKQPLLSNLQIQTHGYFSVIFFIKEIWKQAVYLGNTVGKKPICLPEISRRQSCPFWLSINGVAFAKYGDS